MKKFSVDLAFLLWKWVDILEKLYLRFVVTEMTFILGQVIIRKKKNGGQIKFERTKGRMAAN